MKRIQTFHGFTTLVPDRPLEYLWTPAGYWTPHEHMRSLSALEIDRLLAESSVYRLIEARTGAQLRWYSRGDYGFWYHHAKLHLQPAEVTPQKSYAASEWFDPDAGDRVILFQQQ